MANYLDSLLLGFQDRVLPKLNEAELRELQNPILRIGLSDNNQYIVNNVEEIKETEFRPVYGYQKTRKTATNGTARAYNHTGVQGTTQQVQLNWVTFSETFSFNLTSGLDNVVKHQEIIDNEMQQTMRILRERIGTYFVQQLHANRTAYTTGLDKNATFNTATNAFEISDNNMYWAYAASLMKQYKYYDKFMVLADSMLFPQYLAKYAQGAQNATNQSFQFLDMSNIWLHNVLNTTIATPYNLGVSIFLPQNSFATVPWIPKVNRTGSGEYDSYNGGFGTLMDDTGLPLEYALHMYSLRADQSSTGGQHQDQAFYGELSVDIAFQNAVISNAGETPIYEIGLIS